VGRKEIFFGLFLMALSVLFYGLTYQFPRQTLAFSPKIFPRFVSACLFVVAAVMVGQGIAALRRGSPAGPPRPPADRAFLIRFSLGLLMGYAYTRLLTLTGYLVLTPPFIAGVMLVFKEKRWLRIVATSIITPIVLYLLFRKVFKVPLPRFNLF